jgi:hypothetical protein
MIALLSLSVTLVATLAKSSDEELCVGASCGADVQSHSLLQRKHVSAAPAQAHEEKATAKKRVDAPPCEGVDSDGRCWYMSELGQTCDATCLKHGRSFKYKMPGSKPITAMLLNKEPQSQEGPWRAFECYKPEEDHLHLVSKCSANDYRDNQGSWSDASCQLACPCGEVKECGWRQPEECAPVFQYKGDQLTGCPKVDSDKPWCSHDHDNADQWSSCVYTCTDASENGATEMFSEPPFPEEAEEIQMMATSNPEAFVLRSASIVGNAAHAEDCLLHEEKRSNKNIPKTVASKDPQAIDKEMTQATVGFDSQGDSQAASVVKKAEEEAIAIAMTHRPSADTAAKTDDSATKQKTLKESDEFMLSSHTDLEEYNKQRAKNTEKSIVEPSKPEERINIGALKNDNALWNAELDGIASAEEKESKVVELHNHSSDPHKEEESEKKDEGSEKKAEETNKEEEASKDEPKEETVAPEGNASTEATESSEKSGAFQPSKRSFALLTLPLIAGMGMHM